ncbi:helix-turn-helix domain-containing protein [Murimonas intestini]|uniref:helix-turn-helix domain-containing protein n=1 Tax=Murimonas intestini TaxID=1337051 RepID=UPI0011DCE2BA|nr:helix-turn-helix domain-containing protein [Murimonas intestini]
MKNNEITVFVTEDEPIILGNIVKKVERAGDSIRVCGQATTGEDTLRKFQDILPDILITDIEMPGMNGLDLIRSVRESYPQVHIVILSGYSNFEYARTAIKYGVDDYLLKPASQDEISRLLNKISAPILESRRQQERNILSMAIQGDAPLDSMPSSFSDGCFLLAHITLGGPPVFLNSAALPSRPAFLSSAPGLWGRLDLSGLFSPEGTPGADYFWLIDEHYPLQKFLILHIKELQADIRFTARRLHQHIRQQLENMPYFVLCMASPLSCRELWQAARRMREALPRYTAPALQGMALLEEDPQLFSPPAKKLRQDIDTLGGMDSPSSFLSYSRNILEGCLKERCSQSVTESCLYDIFRLAASLFQLPEAQVQKARCQFCERMVFSTTNAELCAAFEDILKELLKASPLEAGSEQLCLKIQEYLADNYQKKLSVSDLSEKFGYTPSYINRMFKKEFGCPPLQYLTGLRIEQAKKLLEREIDIKLIASATGYEDARYFSRVFKNETGMTPSQWTSKRSSSVPLHPQDTDN